MKSTGSRRLSTSSLIGFCDFRTRVSIEHRDSNTKPPDVPKGRINEISEGEKDTHKELRPFNPFGKIIHPTLQLNIRRRLTRQHPYLLMRLLSRHTMFIHKTDDDVFRPQKWQFMHQLGMNHGGEDDKPAGDVVQAQKDRVGEEKHLGDIHAAAGAVVEGAFEPLLGIEGGEVGV